MNRWLGLFCGQLHPDCEFTGTVHEKIINPTSIDEISPGCFNRHHVIVRS